MDCVIEYNIDGILRELSNYCFDINKKELSKSLEDLSLHETVKLTKKKLRIFKKLRDEDLAQLCKINFRNFYKNFIKIKYLKKVKKKVSSSILKNKLNDVILLFKNYNIVLEKSKIKNPSYFLKEYRILKKIDIFKNSILVFGSLDYLNLAQLNIFKEALKQSKKLKVIISESLEKDASNSSVLKELIDFAKKIKAKIKISTYEKEKEKRKILYFEANNVFEEVEQICRFIKKQTLRNNYNSDDFCIFVKNTEDYLGLLKESLKKYNISYSLKEKICARMLLVPKFICILLELLLKGFNTKRVFQFLELGLLDISSDEIDKLKIYNEQYGIYEKDWIGGFSKYKVQEDEIEKLESLNKTRKKVVDPILELKENLEKRFFFGGSFKNEFSRKNYEECIEKRQVKFENTESKHVNNIMPPEHNKAVLPKEYRNFAPLEQFLTTFEVNPEVIISEINNFFEKNNIKKNVENLISFLNSESFSEEAKNILGSWVLVKDIFEDITNFFKEKKITFGEFYKILKLLVNNSFHFKGERFLNTVNILKDLKDIESYKTKVLIILGATNKFFENLEDGPFSFFVSNEIKELKKLGLNIFCDVSEKIEKEKLDFKKNLKSSSELSLITWPKIDVDGEESKLSDFFRNEGTTFSLNKLDALAKTGKNEFLCWDDIFYFCSSKILKNREHAEIFEIFFKEKKEYQEKIDILKRSKNENVFALKNYKLENNLIISPTQVESYYSCALKFFLKYILKLKEIKKEDFDNLKYGSLVHYVLEKVLKKYSAERILSFSDEVLKKIILELSNDYSKNKFNYLLVNNKKNKDLLKRSSYILVHTLKHIAKGLIKSDFVPEFFELRIGNTLPVLSFKLENYNLELVGKIDRLDIFKNQGCGKEINYLRIIDYKTGKKEFNFLDFFYGLNLQMLIYMLTILKNGEYLNLKNPKFAGVLYMPVKNTTVLSKNKYLENGKIESSRLKSLRMNGLILDDILIANAMENGVEGEYIPVTLKDNRLKKDEKTLVSTAQANLIFKYTEYLIKKMAKEVTHRNFSPTPLKSKNYCSCDFCPYKNICKIEYKEDFITELSEKSIEETYKEINEKLKTAKSKFLKNSCKDSN